jgi:predicted alpha-1,6-mannanase (GH76 family)
VSDTALVDRAEQSQQVLVRDFWKTHLRDGWPGLFRVRTPARLRDHTRVHYWWQAQALDVLLDRQERAPTAENRDRIVALMRGVRRANRRRWTNDFYDDMGWMALALLRADGMGIPAIAIVRELYAAILQGWNATQGGGIAWRTPQPDYKNVPSNGPAAILAARLYARDRRPEDLAQAERIVAYMHARLVDSTSGRVWDGVNRRGDGAADRDWTFSYDVGLVVGADLALAAVTGDGSLRERAGRIAHANHGIIAPDGVLKDEGDGDGALFRGVAARYLVQLGDEEVDEVLRRSAQAAWRSRNAMGRFGASWTGEAGVATELSAQVGSTMLIEQFAGSRSSG